MEILSNSSLPAFVLLISFTFVVGLTIFWKTLNAMTRRRAARAMKRGNDIYREWRQDTVRQPLP